MIDFRYHIVSIAAVFLALGIGVATGATVLDRVTVDQLRGQLDGLSARLDQSRADITELRRERDRARDIVGLLAPRVGVDALAEANVLYVRDGPERDWHVDVREALERAGASSAGTLVLTEKWSLEGSDDRQELIEAFAPIELDADDPAEHAASLLGELVTSDAGAEVVRRIAEAGFVTIAPSQAGLFPPGPVQVLAFATVEDGPLADLVLGAAGLAPTVAVSATPDELGTLEALRAAGDPPPTLSTFDVASADPSNVGTLLAMQAAIQGRGGHFGDAGDLPYALPPA